MILLNHTDNKNPRKSCNLEPAGDTTVMMQREQSYNHRNQENLSQFTK